MIILDIFKIILIAAAFNFVVAELYFETIQLHHFYPDRFFLIFEFHLFEFNIIFAVHGIYF